ncbi:MAG: gluconate 5-dehydrogenase [Blastocatellia bacterium AA13]|nr:MAG: gluconate 5-dehydrogenase [Blastocatellia bacterium AA13]
MAKSYANIARTKFDQNAEVDFLIIGAGASGGIIAKELATAGFRVVALEQGPYLSEKDFVHDEFKFMQQRAITNDYKRQPNTFRHSEKEEAKVQPAIIYGRLVGGGSVPFAANYWRLHEIDFIERSKLGPIAGTGFSDWPITYAELEPYYTKAEWDLGVSGAPGPFDSPRSRPYPLPPLPIKSSGVLAERAARKLGWHAQPAPMAILSKPYRGRSACAHCGFCSYFGCEMEAKSSTLTTVIREAEKTGRCEIRPNSYVRQIEVNKAGLVTGVTYFDENRKERFQAAKAVVLSANGAETPKLLLMSKSSKFPHGLANSSGKVGKYLMFNGHANAGAVFEQQLNEFKSVAVSRIIHDFYNCDPKRGFYGGGGLDTRFVQYPLGFAIRGLPPDAPRWGREYKRMLAEQYTRTLTVLCHTTSLAVESNNITLDPHVKDEWGLPAVRVTYTDHASDLKMMQFLQDRAKELLDAAGARKVWARPVGPQSFGFHLLGTCRMGNDPKESVIDKDHRTHDVPNLFISDGSSMVTSGRGQPTCTIQALAYRASDRIVQLAKSGEIKSAL